MKATCERAGSTGPPRLHPALNLPLGPRPWRREDLSPELFCQSLSSWHEESLSQNRKQMGSSETFPSPEFPTEQNKLSLSHSSATGFSESFIFFPENPPKMVTKLSYFHNALYWTSVPVWFFCLAGIFLEEMCWGHLFHCGVFFLDFRDGAFKYHTILRLRADSFASGCHDVFMRDAWKMQSGHFFVGNLSFTHLFFYTVAVVDVSL